MLAIIHAELVLPDRLVPDATVLCDNGVIVDYGKDVAVPKDAEILDAEGLYVGPGLIDIHCHSAGNISYFDDPVTSCRSALEHGATTVFPTLYFNLTGEEMIRDMDVVLKANEKGLIPNFGGFYTEGPYMNENHGADRHTAPWAGEVLREKYLPVLEKAGEWARVWALAPEKGADALFPFMEDARRCSPKVCFAVGHSEAEAWQVDEFIENGLTIATHHTDAVGYLSKYPECRTSGVVEAVQRNDGVYAELICDEHGVHVDPYVIRLTRKIKGKDKLILITDAACFAGACIREDRKKYRDLSFDFNGELAGSKLTMADACRNFLIHSGASVVETFLAASTNPAKATHLTDRGIIRKGKKADLVVCDDMFRLSAVVLNGKVVK